MKNKITIMGLGEIGASIGLAFSAQKENIERVGNDLKKKIENKALGASAIDKASHNVFDAIEGADIIFLAMPTAQIEETLKLIGQEIGENVVVIEFGAAKRAAIEWAKKYMKYPSNLLSLYPAISPDQIDKASDGIASASADLFRNATMFISSFPETNEGVIKLSADFATLVGAHPSFIDADELDGLIASSVDLPLIVSLGSFSTINNQSGWVERQKLGSKELSAIAKPINKSLDPAYDRKIELTLNKDNVVRMINTYIYDLKELRDAIQNEDNETLSSLIKKSHDAHENWINDYNKASWLDEGKEKTETPSSSEIFSHLFLGKLGQRRDKK